MTQWRPLEMTKHHAKPKLQIYFTILRLEYGADDGALTNGCSTTYACIRNVRPQRAASNAVTFILASIQSFQLPRDGPLVRHLHALQPLTLVRDV
jgi:hypothetical protein